MKRGLALSLFMFVLPAQSEVYKCRQPNGRTEISNAPCSAGSSTIKAIADDVVPEENRRKAEHNVEQMRAEAEKLETVRRADQANERKQQEKQQQASGPAESMIQDCLRTLERMALDAARRAELEATCRSSGSIQPVYVPAPYYVAPVYVRRPKPQPKPEPLALPPKQPETIDRAYTPPPGNLRPR